MHTVDRRPPLHLVVLIGVAAGLLGGTFGVGGGLIIVPGLMAIGFERKLAHGTSLMAFLPIVTASVLTYLANDNVDWAVALFLAVGSIGGAILGTKLIHVVPKRTLTIIFIVAVVLTAARLFLDTDAPGRDPLSFGDVVFLLAVGLLTGTLAGLLGIGGGIIMIPAMMLGLHMQPVMAKGTSTAVIIPTSIVGTLRNRKTANVDMRSAMIVGFAGVPTAVIGGMIAEHLSDEVSNITFALLLVVVAVIQLRTLRQGEPEIEPLPEQAFE